MTSTFQLLCGDRSASKSVTPRQRYIMGRSRFFCQRWAVKPLHRWPTMQHSAPPLDFSSVCKSVSHAVTVHNGVTEKCPHYQGHFWGFFFLFLFSCRQNIFFNTVVSNTKGIPRRVRQHLCCSPKINNVPSYTTRLSSLNLNGKRGRCSTRIEVAALIAVSRTSPIMHSWSFRG